MPSVDMRILRFRRLLVSGVLFFVFFSYEGFFDPAPASPADKILRLTSDKEYYFLGPYLEYLEDPQKKLTIEAVSSPQMSGRFIKHTAKVLNLGQNPYAYWVRFTVLATAVKDLNRKWLLYFGRPNSIDHATLFIPDPTGSGWTIKEVGRILPTGPDPMPSTPSAFLPPSSFNQAVSFYLRIESSVAKQIPLQILTEEAYQEASRRRSSWLGVYYGIMLAMFLYNLIWLVSLRELNRLFYLLYLLSMALMFLAINELLREFFIIGVHLNRVLLFIFLCLAFFWANLFAKTFLITKKYAPLFDRLLSVCAVLALMIAVMLPFVNLARVMFVVFIQNLVVPPIFLLAGFTAWQRGFRPARFYLISFVTLALSTIYESLVFFGVFPVLTLHSAQFASAIEVILLQLALADRFRTLSQEQDRIIQSLHLAREVQQNLLPHKDPQLDGLDIAGKSIYCDETGGDYYDFIITERKEKGQIGIAIGDVSGHGISSALLMSAVRSSLRQRCSLPGSAAGIISDVNRQLVRDVEDSGQFITMFYLTIDPIQRHLQWVRAGHDPAIFYEPVTGSFEALSGSGIALGVNEDWNYEEYTKTALHKGQIIFLSTDGIWEARNPRGEMFGKERIYDIIRNDSSLSAKKILNAMLDALSSFQKGIKLDDDITLVIIKFDH